MRAPLKWNKEIKMWAKNASTLLIEDRGVNEAVIYVLAERTLLRNALTRIGRPVGRGRLRGMGCTRWGWSPRLEIGDWWKNLLNSYAFLRRPTIYSLETRNQSGTWYRELSVKHLKVPVTYFTPTPTPHRNTKVKKCLLQKPSVPREKTLRYWHMNFPPKGSTGLITLQWYEQAAKSLVSCS